MNINRRMIRVDCTEPTCPNYQMVGDDAPVPAQPWRCSPCEDALLEQQVNALARIEDARRAMLGRDESDTF